MGLSFTPTAGGSLARSDDKKKRAVLVTGAAGRIGSYFAEHAHEKHALRLMVREGDNATGLDKFGEVVVADLMDLARMKEVCAGIDTVVHLAGIPWADSTWAQLLEPNIIGCYHAFVAAKAAECRRLIFASSIHAVSGYRRDVQSKTSDPVNPGDLYGVTKCFGEALGRYMAEQENLSVIALRIGAFQPLENAQKPESIHMMDAFISRRDLTQLINRCIDVENLQFAIFNGLSNNRFKRMDISDARELVGYEPQDDLAAENPKLEGLNLSSKIRTHSRLDHWQKSGLRDDL